METTKKAIDFQGQSIFAGIDVHKKQWKVTIILAGVKVKTFSMDPKPEQLAKFLKCNFPNATYYTVYEAGFSGFWIDRALKLNGINNIIVNPADVPTSNKDKDRKSDIIDSQKLAKELSKDNLKQVYVPSEEQEAIRVLARLRMQFTKDQTRVKNRIKSLLYFTGTEFPENYLLKHWSGTFIVYLEKLKCKNPVIRTALSELINNLKNIKYQQAKVLKEIRKYLKENPEQELLFKYLVSIPGIGFTIAITLVTEIIDINRFKHLNHLASFVGLVPSTHSSGEMDIITGMSRRQNSFLRGMIVEAAWVAIRFDPVLMQSFSLLSKRMNKQEAIIRIAKKLLNRIMFVWKNKQMYKTSVFVSN